MKMYQIILGFMSIVLSACSPIYYAPNVQNVPMISEKHELSISGSTDERQFNIQGAFGISDELAIQANYFNYRRGEHTGLANFYEAGLGYYNADIKPFNFEIYGLIGAGNLSVNFEPRENYDGTFTGGTLVANVTRVGMQPIFAFKSKYFTAAVATRVLAIKYANIGGGLIFEDDNQIDYLRSNDTQYFVEPSITLQAGIKNFKLQAQYLFSTNVLNFNFPYEEEVFTLGAVVNLNVRKKEKLTKQNRK